MSKPWLIAFIAALAIAPSALAQPTSGTATSSPARTNDVILRGSGARVLSVNIPRSSPLVITGTHRGESNFIVHLARPGSNEYVFNEIGVYTGQALVDAPRAGRYRVVVDADGPWTLRFAQPRPSATARLVPGLITGTGARVIQIRTSRGMQPIVTGTHRGESNFIVHLVGLSVRGTEFLFNEIGRYRGQTLIEDLPRGNYLLGVSADGPWSIRFTR